MLALLASGYPYCLPIPTVVLSTFHTSNSVTTPLPHTQSTCDADLHTGYFAQLMHGMTPLFWQAPRRKRGLFKDTISDGMTPTQLPRRDTLFQGAFLEIKRLVKGVWAPIRNAFVRCTIERTARGRP